MSSCRSKYITAFYSVSDDADKVAWTENVKKMVKTDNMWEIDYSLDLETQGLRVEGKVRIIHDSLIWANVKKMGLEAMRIKLTTDSVWVLDRLQKRYFEGSYADFERYAKVPIDFQLCQAIFLNEPYLAVIKPDKLQKNDSVLVFRSQIEKEHGALDVEQSYFLEPLYLKAFGFWSKASQTKASIFYKYDEKLSLNGFDIETSSNVMRKAYFKIKEMETKDKLSTRFKISKKYEKIRF